MTLHYGTIQYISNMTWYYSPLRLRFKRNKKINWNTLLFNCKIFTCINRAATRPFRLSFFQDISSHRRSFYSALLSSPVFPVFLHTNKVSSCILIWISCILTWISCIIIFDFLHTNEVPSSIQMRCLPPY